MCQKCKCNPTLAERLEALLEREIEPAAKDLERRNAPGQALVRFFANEIKAMLTDAAALRATTGEGEWEIVPEGDTCLVQHPHWGRHVFHVPGAAPPPPLREQAVPASDDRSPDAGAVACPKCGAPCTLSRRYKDANCDVIVSEFSYAHPAPAQVDEGVALEIVAKYVGRTSNIFRFVRDDLRALATAQQSVSKEGKS